MIEIMLLHLLDIGFFVFHTLLVGFILCGWAWHRTRRLHFGVVIAVIFSWTVLGVWYGWGYCPCTDWHWEVRTRLGDSDLPDSYLKYVLDRCLGTDLSAMWVDAGAVLMIASALLLTVYMNFCRQKGG